MKKIFFIIILCFLIFFNQAFGLAPSWFKNPQYGYFTGYGFGENKNQAYIKAYNDAYLKILQYGQFFIDGRGSILNDKTALGGIVELHKRIQKTTNGFEAFIALGLEHKIRLTKPLTVFACSLIPGGGQFYKNQYMKALVFFTATASLLSAAYNSDYKADEAFWKSKYYKDRNDEVKFNYFHDLANFHLKNRNTFLISAGFVYVLNFLDAALGKQKPRFDFSMNLSLNNPGFMLTYNY